MRNRKAARTYVPVAEGVEERVLTTAGVTGGGIHEAYLPPREAILERRTIAAEHRATALEHRLEAGQARREAVLNRREALAHRRFGAAAVSEGLRALDQPPPIGPGLGKGLLRTNLPYSHSDYGVVSIWNNTNDRVTFLVGASTHQSGRFQAFTLFPGRTQSYFAYSTINGDPPVFQVALPNQGEPYTLPSVNIVFQQNGYYAPAKSGYPYAINVGVNGYNLSYI